MMTFDTNKVLRKLEWCMGASFAAYPDFWSCNEGSGNLGSGQGCAIGTSTKQKPNVDSSATAELAVVGQLSPLVVWALLFLEEQGHPIKTNCICQDNNSAILLWKNRKARK